MAIIYSAAVWIASTMSPLSMICGTRNTTLLHDLEAPSPIWNAIGTTGIPPRFHPLICGAGMATVCFAMFSMMCGAVNTTCSAISNARLRHKLDRFHDNYRPGSAPQKCATTRFLPWSEARKSINLLHDSLWYTLLKHDHHDFLHARRRPREMHRCSTYVLSSSSHPPPPPPPHTARLPYPCKTPGLLHARRIRHSTRPP